MPGVPYPRPRLSYLLKEFFGLHDPNDLYIYITDGGHWENTGLVELIRDRNIDEVVCLDADEKPRETATEIATAISLAKLECNADIRLNLDVLRGPRDGWRGTDYSPQSVALGVITRGDHLGLLWYAKPCSPGRRLWNSCLTRRATTPSPSQAPLISSFTPLSSRPIATSVVTTPR
jgi:hypothetical protein